MRYQYESFKYLIFAHRDLTEEYFLRECGAISGYAQDLFRRIYKSLFAESDDVISLYGNYYRREYDTFSEFLQKMYNLPSEKVDEILTTIERYPELRLYDYNSLAYGENFDDFLCSNTVYERFEKIILKNLAYED